MKNSGLDRCTTTAVNANEKLSIGEEIHRFATKTNLPPLAPIKFISAGLLGNYQQMQKGQIHLHR